MIIARCTIHQPSAEIFSLFDDLLLLGEGGHVMYFGPIGEKGEQVLEYTGELGYPLRGVLWKVIQSPYRQFVVECT